MTTTTLALMPDFLDPVTLIGYFGAWAMVGLLVVVFIESGVLFPVLPGDTLLFVAGMLAAGTAAQAREVDANFPLWQLLIFALIAVAPPPPPFTEGYRRRRRAKRAGGVADEPAAEQT